MRPLAAAGLLGVALCAAGCGGGGNERASQSASDVVPELVEVSRAYLADWSPGEPPLMGAEDLAGKDRTHHVDSVEPPSSGSTTVVVHVSGAQDPSSEPCGADYVAEAVLAPKAVGVIVVEHKAPSSGACSAAAYGRLIDLVLAEPLDERELVSWDGVPIPLTELE